MPPPPIALLAVTECRRIHRALAAVARRGPFVAHAVPALRQARRLLPSGIFALLAIDARSARGEAAWVPALRDDGFREPIVWVGAEAAELARLRSSGADDAIAVDVRGAELIERIARFVRAREPTPTVPGIELDARARRVSVGGRSVTLTPREHALLLLLVTRAGRVARKDEIGAAVLLEDGECHNAYFHVHNLKQKLGDAGALVQTVRGEGYRWGAG